MTDLPDTGDGVTAILTVIDKATRMVHLVPCSKTTTAEQTARLYMSHVAKLHGIPRNIYTEILAFTLGFIRDAFEVQHRLSPSNSGGGRTNECGS